MAYYNFVVILSHVLETFKSAVKLMRFIMRHLESNFTFENYIESVSLSSICANFVILIKSLDFQSTVNIHKVLNWLVFSN